MTDVKEAAVSWIAKHIRERWPFEQQTEEMAENLDAIAREYEVPVKTLIEWIHFLPNGADLSAEDFRAWAIEYARRREEALENVMREEDNTP